MGWGFPMAGCDRKEAILNIEVHLYVHDNADDKKLDQILKLLQTVILKENQMAATLDQVLTDITDLNNVEDGVIALLTQIKAMLDAAGTDPVKIQAVADQIAAMKQKAADAIAANTPSAPTP